MVEDFEFGADAFVGDGRVEERGCVRYDALEIGGEDGGSVQ